MQFVMRKGLSLTGLFPPRMLQGALLCVVVTAQTTATVLWFLLFTRHRLDRLWFTDVIPLGSVDKQRFQHLFFFLRFDTFSKYTHTDPMRQIHH